MSLVRFAICALLFASPAVHAEPVATVSIEPLFLVATMVDSTIEVKPTDHLGIAALAGYGLPVTGATLWDLGGEANVYLQRSFSGLHVGAELRYMGGSMSLLGTHEMSDGTDRILGAY